MNNIIFDDEFHSVLYHCLICDDIFAGDEIDDHLVEDHFEFLEDYYMAVKAGHHWEFSIDALALPFVELY